MKSSKKISRRRTKYQGVYERESSTRICRGRPDICYDIAFRFNGRLVWEKAGWLSEGYTPKLASEIRGDRIRSIRHSEELPQQKKKIPLFKSLMAKYLDWAKNNKCDQGEHDKTRYNLHLAPYLDEKKLDEITSFDIEKIKTTLLKKELSPATVKHCLIIVRQAFNKALTWGLYKGANPVKGVKMPVLQNQRERFLSYEEAEKLLNGLSKRSPDVHDMSLLSLHTGMRAGEIFNLRCHDIDLTHGFITIMDTKNRQARKAFMTDAVKAMLSRRIKDLGPDDHIFTSRRKKPYLEMADIFKKAVDELFNGNVKDRRQRVTFHTLRHTFGSWLALQGESLVTIRELLGHKSFAMTQRYAHLIPDEKKRAVTMLEKAFIKKNNGTADIAHISEAV